MLIIIGLIISPFIFARVENNRILDGYANQLYDIPLPAKTMLLSKTKSVGNLFGTGNHLDFVATMKVQSYLS